VAKISIGSCSTQPGLRVVLLEFALGGTHHVGVTIKDDRSRTGGALVQRNDVVLILNVGHVDCLAE
jgi:hypothetical protein